MITNVQLFDKHGNAPTGGPGRFVRLWGLHPDDLPPAPTPAKELEPFITTVLHEALPFIEDVPADSSSNTSAWHHEGVMEFPNSAAPVNLYKRIVPEEDLRTVLNSKDDVKSIDIKAVRSEVWNLRRSVHRDGQMLKTASWDEWERYFKDDHAQAELSFTPAIQSTQRLKSWKNVKDLKIIQGDHTWTNVTMAWEESVHKLPFPLKKRVFPVLQITASDENHASGAEFMIIQIAMRDGEAPGRYNAVLGAYTSVERLRLTADGVEWVMATASDAKGVLPPKLQQKAVPKKIAEDVDMFLGWVVKDRVNRPLVPKEQGDQQTSDQTQRLSPEPSNQQSQRPRSPTEKSNQFMRTFFKIRQERAELQGSQQPNNQADWQSSGQDRERTGIIECLRRSPQGLERASLMSHLVLTLQNHERIALREHLEIGKARNPRLVTQAQGQGNQQTREQANFNLHGRRRAQVPQAQGSALQIVQRLTHEVEEALVQAIEQREQAVSDSHDNRRAKNLQAHWDFIPFAQRIAHETQEAQEAQHQDETKSSRYAKISGLARKISVVLRFAIVVNGNLSARRQTVHEEYRQIRDQVVTRTERRDDKRTNDQGVVRVIDGAMNRAMDIYRDLIRDTQTLISQLGHIRVEAATFGQEHGTNQTIDEVIDEAMDQRISAYRLELTGDIEGAIKRAMVANRSLLTEIHDLLDQYLKILYEFVDDWEIPPQIEQACRPS
ncbi:hypothetical protein QQS21_007037 [Conoideocrella luteorostrata]|uniref:DUF3074 domain-containing protein n=1 Tax=Conoideocrella luteorostrata TaxID=1105319 RepID=A0AAJ0CLG5_9HYPO|nr:hypothetical protein QQS21_007037 [Conoideocrella luteorostrata]